MGLPSKYIDFLLLDNDTIKTDLTMNNMIDIAQKGAYGSIHFSKFLKKLIESPYSGEQLDTFLEDELRRLRYSAIGEFKVSKRMHSMALLDSFIMNDGVVSLKVLVKHYKYRE